MTHVDGKPVPSSQRLKQLGQYASSPGHSGLAVTQNSPFSSLAVAVAIASTHCAYPLRDGQAKLTWLYTEIDFPAAGVEPQSRSPIPVVTVSGEE